MLLGDRIKYALDSVGITEERVRKWLGNCNCEERRRRLNQLQLWSLRIVKGKTSKARYYLQQLLDQEEE